MNTTETNLENLPATAAIEVAVVECGSDQGARYNELRGGMLNILRSQPGFIAWRGFESDTRPGVMLDLLYWEKPEACRRAQEQLQGMPQAQEFFALIKETHLFEMFRRQM